MEKRCRKCKYFKRGKWIKSLGGGDQCSGNCKILATVLGMDNTELFLLDVICVQDTFGCSLFREDCNIEVASMTVNTEAFANKMPLIWAK